MYDDLMDAFNLYSYGATSSFLIGHVENNNFFSTGTAFCVAGKNYFLTCLHCVDITKDLYIALPKFRDGFIDTTTSELTCWKVKLIRKNVKHDVALLKADTFFLKSAYQKLNEFFKNSSDVNVLDEVIYCGYPLYSHGSGSLKWSKSSISSKNIVKDEGKHYVLDSVIHPGNSGGPLIDPKTFQVIGIIASTFDPSGNTGMFVNGLKMGNTSIGRAICIEHAFNLLKAEGLYE